MNLTQSVRQALLVLSLLPLAAVTHAQVKLTAPPMRPPAYLAKMPAVQVELGLTDEQKTKIEQTVPKPTPIPVGTKDPVNYETMYERVKEILTPAQTTRLEQLNRQYYGAYALTYPATAKEYGLTANQIERIGIAYTEALEEVASESLVMDGGSARIVINHEGMAKVARATMAEAKKILTEDQLKKFTESLGVLLKFKEK